MPDADRTLTNVIDLSAFRARRHGGVEVWDGRTPVYSRTAKEILFSVEAAIWVCRHRRIELDDLDLVVAEAAERRGPLDRARAAAGRRRVRVAPHVEQQLPVFED
ncbi:MAG: hypothetical protein JSR54_12380 [Proteobacteria bacterium]|nr:hypothetical protein [Pseudomonadota bacterium]